VKILVACEESQAVTIELRKLGHEAYSCDLKKCSGGKPQWHLKCDVLSVIDGGAFVTESGEEIVIDKWDMMIAHPVCKFLTNSGVRWLWIGKKSDGIKNFERWDNLKKGAEFFVKLMNADIPLIAIENPIPHKYAIDLIGSKYDQLVQPYHFGHTESKATCFWLKGLNSLVHRNNVYKQMMKLPKKERCKVHFASPGPDREALRSKTYQGIARAMAEQWAGELKEQPSE